MADRILIDRAVVQQALSLCESVQGLRTDDEDGSTVWCQELIEALRAALAQAEPVEAVATFDDPYRDHWAAIAEAAQRIATSKECGPAEAKALCAALDRLTEATLAEPVKRKPLTDAEIDKFMQSIGLRCADEGNPLMSNHAEWQRRTIAGAIKQAHGIKGGGNG